MKALNHLKSGSFCAIFMVFSIVRAAASQDIVVVGADSDAKYIVDAGKTHIERITARIGLRTVKLAARVVPRQTPRRVNFCLNRKKFGFPKPQCNSCEPSYGDSVWGAIDGVPWEGEFEWSSDYRNPEVPFYQIAFGRTETIGEIRLALRRGYPMRDFDIRWQDASGNWQTIEEMRGQNKEYLDFVFKPVRAQAIGVLCLRGPDHQPTIRRITEIEAFGPQQTAPHRPVGFAYVVKPPKGAPLYLEVREVYGERDTLSNVDYDIRLDGNKVFHRSHVCDGPGPVSYFVPTKMRDGAIGKIQFVDTSGNGISIARIRLVSDPVGKAGRRNLLHPLIVVPRIELHAPYTDPQPEQALKAWVSAMEPAKGFLQPGLLAIVGYANPDATTVAAKIRAYADLAARCHVPWILQLSSWWADTPLHVPDGLGGTFGDIRYQQIAYSKFDNYEDPGLKDFMDSESPGTYDIHYGLTTPNIWSNTPWLTMNNKRLNAFKMECLRSAVEVVNEIQSRPDGYLLRAIVTDDEPMYWSRIVDGFSNGYGRVNNGVVRSDLLLDFNPSVVKDAAADGVRLDPVDGLDATERLWLHENDARYSAMVCNTIYVSLHADDAKGDRANLRESIFNYLLAQPIYPLENYGHPGWEMGIVPHAAIGLEAGDERYFERARDLGPLANSDFECANPGSNDVTGWEPRFQAWHDVGCRFVQLCNPGPASNWRLLFEHVAKWNKEERTAARAMSAIVQEAATAEWRRSAWSLHFEPPKPAK